MSVFIYINAYQKKFSNRDLVQRILLYILVVIDAIFKRYLYIHWEKLPSKFYKVPL